MDFDMLLLNSYRGKHLIKNKANSMNSNTLISFMRKK